MPGSVLDRKERKKPVTNTKKEKEVKEKKREGKIRATKEKEGYLEARKAHTKQYNVPVALERRSSGGLNPWSCRKLLSHLRGHKRKKNGNRHSRRWSSLSTTATATKRERETCSLPLWRSTVLLSSCITYTDETRTDIPQRANHFLASSSVPFFDFPAAACCLTYALLSHIPLQFFFLFFAR